MKNQGKWLFELPTVAKMDGAINLHICPEYEWELDALPMGEKEWETLDGINAPRRSMRLPELTAQPRVLTYTTKDVIDKRISVPAQHSLVRLSKNPATRTDAVRILGEIKAERLAGIYCVNWEIPAKRALRFQRSWWTVIPPGENSVLMLDPDNLLGGQPLIAFRRELAPDCGLLKGEKRFAGSPTKLDSALLRAWQTYLRFQQRKILPCLPAQGQNTASSASVMKLQAGKKSAPYPVVPPCCELAKCLCLLEDKPPQTKQQTRSTCWAAGLSSLLRASPNAETAIYSENYIISRVKQLEIRTGEQLLDAGNSLLIYSDYSGRLDLRKVAIVYHNFGLPGPQQIDSSRIYEVVQSIVCDSKRFVYLNFHKPEWVSDTNAWYWHSWVIFAVDCEKKLVHYMDPDGGGYKYVNLPPNWTYFLSSRRWIDSPPSPIW